MLPPHSSTQTVSSGARVILPDSSAASPAAPAPSTTSLARWAQWTMALAISSSLTSTTSLTSALIIGSVSSPGRLTAMPSAIVCDAGAVTVTPASSEARTGAQPSACTPITRTSGFSACSAVAMPAISPPPPMGTITVVTAGNCSRISKPIVPCPLMTASSSKA